VQQAGLERLDVVLQADEFRVQPPAQGVLVEVD